MMQIERHRLSETAIYMCMFVVSCSVVLSKPRQPIMASSHAPCNTRKGWPVSELLADNGFFFATTRELYQTWLQNAVCLSHG